MPPSSLIRNKRTVAGSTNNGSFVSIYTNTHLGLDFFSHNPCAYNSSLAFCRYVLIKTHNAISHLYITNTFPL